MLADRQLAGQGREMLLTWWPWVRLTFCLGRSNADSLKKALLTRVPAGTEKLNRKALRRDMEEAAKNNRDALPRSLLK